MPKAIKELWGAIHGTTSLGERGQVVVPKKLRDSLELEKGDDFIVLEKGGAIVLIPSGIMSKFVADITGQLKNIKK